MLVPIKYWIEETNYNWYWSKENVNFIRTLTMPFSWTIMWHTCKKGPFLTTEKPLTNKAVFDNILFIQKTDKHVQMEKFCTWNELDRFLGKISMLSICEKIIRFLCVLVSFFLIQQNIVSILIHLEGPMRCFPLLLTVMNCID